MGLRRREEDRNSEPTISYFFRFASWAFENAAMSVSNTGPYLLLAIEYQHVSGWRPLHIMLKVSSSELPQLQFGAANRPQDHEGTEVYTSIYHP